jgi:hypothetical protein
MQSSSGYLFGIGLGIMLLSVLNHFVIKADPVAHTTSIVFALGFVIAAVGVALAVFTRTKAG